jgi:hypothetical protein
VKAANVSANQAFAQNAEMINFVKQKMTIGVFSLNATPPLAKCLTKYLKTNLYRAQ